MSFGGLPTANPKVLLLLSPAEYQQHLRDVRTPAAAHAAVLGQAFGGQVETFQDNGSISKLIKRVIERNVDLIVKGVHPERSPGHSLLTGSGWLYDADKCLLRRSPVPAWFVKNTHHQVGKVLAAIGHAEPDPGAGFIEHRDYDTFYAARNLADVYGADVEALHIVEESPRGQPAYDISGHYLVALRASQVTRRNDRSVRHGRQLSAFKAHFNLDVETLRVQTGKPAVEIPSYAMAGNCDLIVVAADEMNGLRRLTAKTVAEPILAMSPCDVLVLKDCADRFARALEYRAKAPAVGILDVPAPELALVA